MLAKEIERIQLKIKKLKKQKQKIELNKKAIKIYKPHDTILSCNLMLYLYFSLLTILSKFINTLDIYQSLWSIGYNAKAKW